MTMPCTNNGEWYENSPYAMLWNDDRYYLLGYSEKHNKVVTFRIDRMCVPQHTNDGRFQCSLKTS